MLRLPKDPQSELTVSLFPLPPLLNFSPSCNSSQTVGRHRDAPHVPSTPDAYPSEEYFPSVPNQSATSPTRVPTASSHIPVSFMDILRTEGGQPPGRFPSIFRLNPPAVPSPLSHPPEIASDSTSGHIGGSSSNEDDFEVPSTPEPSHGLSTAISAAQPDTDGDVVHAPIPEEGGDVTMENA